MEILILLIAVVAVGVVFELAAVRFGADSREGSGDPSRRHSGGGSF